MFFMIFSVKISVMDIESVKKLAVLCRIDIKEDEIEELRKEMGAILQYVGEISDVATEERVSEVGVLKNVMREDGESHESGAYTDAILSEAPSTEGRYVKVKKIL